MTTSMLVMSTLPVRTRLLLAVPNISTLCLRPPLNWPFGALFLVSLLLVMNRLANSPGTVATQFLLLMMHRVRIAVSTGRFSGMWIAGIRFADMSLSWDKLLLDVISRMHESCWAQLQVYGTSCTDYDPCQRRRIDVGDERCEPEGSSGSEEGACDCTPRAKASRSANCHSRISVDFSTLLVHRNRPLGLSTLQSSRI